MIQEKKLAWYILENSYMWQYVIVSPIFTFNNYYSLTSWWIVSLKKFEHYWQRKKNIALILVNICMEYCPLFLFLAKWKNEKYIKNRFNPILRFNIIQEKNWLGAFRKLLFVTVIVSPIFTFNNYKSNLSLTILMNKKKCLNPNWHEGW
jgi:hypothetical protein